MSRIGRQPIPIPDRVKVAVDRGTVAVEGPLGKLEHRLPPGITCETVSDGRFLTVKRASDAKRHRELHGLTRTLINNMIIGTTQGYRKDLEIHGIGYSVRLEGDALLLQVGFANTIRLQVPDGIKAEVLQPTNPGRLAVSGCDKQRVGDFAARIRAVRPPEPYQGKGIRYAGEAIRRKAGKAFAATAG